MQLDEFNEILGKVSTPFMLMLNGLPGSGKSTFALLLCKKLAQKNFKVLFLTHEEGFSHTLKDKLQRLDIQHPNITFANELKTVEKTLYQYDMVFMDSIQSMKIDIDKFKEFIKQGKKRNTSFVFIFQSTKDGNFKGSSEYEHEVDISLKVEQGIATVRKSRFGGKGEFVVY